MKHFTFLIIILSISLNLFSQEAAEAPKYGISFSGFIKNDFFMDSRQTWEIRDRHFTFYPKAENFDFELNDINANPSINFLAIQSRLKGTVTGPEAFGAKTSGVLEADFFGGGANIFRVRHAMIKLNWDNAELLFGQYWHPMFVTGCFPGTVSFNTGVPFQPFSRNPQVRFSYKVGNLKLMAAAMTQRDFTGIGGFAPLSNSGTPDMHGQIQFASKSVFAGAGAGYKIIKPSLVNNIGLASDDYLGSFYSIAYLRINTKPVTLKFEGVYGQNMHDLLLTSAYAKHEINLTTGEITYTSMNQFTVWTDIHTNGKAIQFGIFAGYMKNLGASDEIIPGSIEHRFDNDILDNVMRVSPRIMFNSGKIRLAAEAEYTVAGYAKDTLNGLYDLDEFGRVNETVSVANLRLLLSVYYFF